MACFRGRRSGASGVFAALLVTMALFGSHGVWSEETDAGRVTVTKTPDGGLQPQAVTDKRGTLHLLYFRGELDSGDLLYSRRMAGAAAFSAPLKVNSQPGAAVARGANRGGQLAVGKDGRAHVVWFGSERVTPRAGEGWAPLLYSRMNDAGTAFETQRDLSGRTYGLDGGPSVSADDSGNVYVVWQAAPTGEGDDATRRPWVAVSRDEGKRFAPGVIPFISETGACSGCQTKTWVDRMGKVYLLYRTSTGRVNRDIALAVSGDHGDRFAGRTVDRWRTEPTETCPQSSEAMAEGPDGVTAAWETRDRVLWGRIDPQTGAVTSRSGTSDFTEKGQKHPALAVNAAGETLLAWTEGLFGQKGGDLVWQVFGRTGQPVGRIGRLTAGLPAWGRPTAAVRADGGFQVWY